MSENVLHNSISLQPALDPQNFDSLLNSDSQQNFMRTDGNIIIVAGGKDITLFERPEGDARMAVDYIMPLTADILERIPEILEKPGEEVEIDHGNAPWKYIFVRRGDNVLCRSRFANNRYDSGFHPYPAGQFCRDFFSALNELLQIAFKNKNIHTFPIIPKLNDYFEAAIDSAKKTVPFESKEEEERFTVSVQALRKSFGSILDRRGKQDDSFAPDSRRLEFP